MFGRVKTQKAQGAELTSAQLQLNQLANDLNAIKSHMGFIEFTPTGEIIDANDLLLAVMGYDRHEVKGQHHRVLCSPDYASLQEYQNFWRDLAKGLPKSGTFKRYNKAGQVVWLEASYFPVAENGQVVKVIKIASDVTADQQSLQDRNALFAALNKSLAVIEFDPSGVILNANENFLKTVGYSLKEIQGKHHRIFCFDDFYQKNPKFWQCLADGNFHSGKFRRKNSAGDSIWLEATYNPIYDSEGKVVKVIKFATDITSRIRIATQAVEAASMASEQTAQITSKARNVLQDALNTSGEVANLVEEASNVTAQLNDQAKSIGDIVTAIQAVAEQTNLLALNAAIEAARAGDQGRGFAVVADEVRQLSGRTSAATEEATRVVNGNRELTDNIRKKMECIRQVSLAGQKNVADLSDSMNAIEQGVANLVDTVSKLDQP